MSDIERKMKADLALVSEESSGSEDKDDTKSDKVTSDQESPSKKENEDTQESDPSESNKTQNNVQSPFKLKIKLGPNKSGELISTDQSPEKRQHIKTTIKLPKPVIKKDKGFHGFSDTEIPMFVYNNFEDIDLKSPIKLKPTMFVSISSKKGNTGKKAGRPVPALMKQLDLPGPEPEPSPKTSRVRFADEETEDSPSLAGETSQPQLPSTPTIANLQKEGTPLLSSVDKKKLKFWEPLYDGWTREIVSRGDKSDPSKIRKEVYYHSPQIEDKPRLKFKNANELEGHLITSGSMYPLTFFTFKKEPLGAPEPMEVIRDANTAKSPAKASSNNTTHDHLEKRVSKNPERLINVKNKETLAEKINKKSVKTSETSPTATAPEIRVSKRVIKPPEKLDPQPTTPQVLKRKPPADPKPAPTTTDASGLWKDPDNIMSPKKSVTFATGKSGTGLLKVKMFSKLNAKNVSDSAKPSKTDDMIDETGIFDEYDSAVDPLAHDPLSDPVVPLDPASLPAGNDDIAVSDEESIRICEDDSSSFSGVSGMQGVHNLPDVSAATGRHKDLPRLVPAQSHMSYSMMNLNSLPPALSIQRSSHLPVRPMPQHTTSLSITPLSNPSSLYPNMQAAQTSPPSSLPTPTTTVRVNSLNRPQDAVKVLFPLRKTLLPCSIHCPGATGFPSLSCKACHCLFHPKCVGLSIQHLNVFKNASFYCNDCKSTIPQSEIAVTNAATQKEVRQQNQIRIQVPQRPTIKSKAKQTVVQPPQPHKTTNQQQKQKSAVPSRKSDDKPRQPESPAPPRPIEHQAIVNIGGKKFLVIPRGDIAPDSPPPSPPQSNDAAAMDVDDTAPRKLPVFLKSADNSSKSGPDFEVEQTFDGSIVIKPIGGVDPVKIFGSGKLKRPLPSAQNKEVPNKRPKIDFKQFHANIADGYFALRHVFRYLSVSDRLRAGQVCKLWNEIGNHASFWTALTLKNLKITNWDCFSAFIRRVGCESIDMRKMIFVKDRDLTWTDILASMNNFPSLKQLQLPRLNGSVLIPLVQEFKHLENLNAPLITSPLDTSTFSTFSKIKELRLKTGSGQLVLNNGLKFLESLTGTLTSLSLLTVTGLSEADYDCIGMLNNLEQVELGDCTGAPITLFKTLSDLPKLMKIRLEKGSVGDNISKLQRGDNLRQLELIDFHVQMGFKEGLKGLNNVRKLLIIPHYKDEVAASNTEILEGITSHLKHLESFYLGVTNEWLQAMSLVIGEQQKSKSPGERECFPLEKDGKVEYLSLPGLYRKVCREMPNTKVKVLKMSAGATYGYHIVVISKDKKMVERRVEVVWVPQKPSHFMTWGSDIRLYRTLDCTEGRADNWDQIGPHRYAEEIQCISELRRTLKCVDLCKGETFHLAVGQATGKVSLVNMTGGTKNYFGGDGCEYIPRQSHCCTAVSWHPSNYSILAAGFEKLRSEHGVVIWDLSQGRQLSQPLSEAANGDLCCSLAWVPNQANLLVAGLSVKTVKIFDTRTSGMKAAKQTSTKATYGLCVDPWSEYRICGFSENDPAIVIWDTRNFEKPIVTSSTPQQISTVSWCPTRRGLLANSYKDSGSIMLRDIMNWAVSQEDGEASVTERSIQPPSTNIGNIIDFAWHPSNSNTLLAMGSANNQFCEWTVSDRLTLNWSARHGLIWSTGARLETAVGEMLVKEQGGGEGQRVGAEFEDISVVMQHRAKLGYAGKINANNLNSFELDSELQTVWLWILNSRSINDSSNQPFRFQGIRAILEHAHVASRVRQSTWTGVDNCKSVRTYYSPERDQVLKLCGWQPLKKVAAPEGKDAKSANMEFFIRNAAVAIFSLNMKSAIDVLKNGTTFFNAKGDSVTANQLNMVSVAISGFSADTSKLWKDLVSSSLCSLPSPTLKSIFAFLACDDEAYKEVLSVNNLDFVDRMAVAHIFLSDNLLKEYLEKEWNNFQATGRLEGVLISKTNNDSLSILQSFVDRTGDIQTACWTGLYILPPEYIKTDKIIEFVQNYRMMLDRWNMFAERSELDITLTSKDPSWDNMVQIYVACNFCGKSVSNSGRNRMNKTGSLTRQATGQQNKNKAQACPSCRKPMPRCAICLVNMGTVSGLNPESKANILTKFDEWFSWCQTCRHGGHAQHMMDWFIKHTICPVTGCACKCASLDATSS